MITKNSSPSEIIAWLQDPKNNMVHISRPTRVRIYELAAIPFPSTIGDFDTTLGWCVSYKDMAEKILRNATKKLIGE